MKKSVLKIFSVFVCIIMLFCGCGFNSGVAIARVQSSTKTSWKQSHYLLNGIESCSLSLGGEPQDMEIEVVTEEGRIDIIVTARRGEEITVIEDAKTGIYEFEASGKVKIKIKAEDHRGSFEIKKADS